MALVLGGIEALSIVATELNLTGFFWDHLHVLSGQFGLLGVIIVSLFILSWIIYKVKKYEDIEVNVTASKPSADITGRSGQ